MALMKSISLPYNIILIWIPLIKVLIDCNFTNNQIVSRDVIKHNAQVSKDNHDFKIATRQERPDILNVWIMNSVTEDGNRKLNGVSFPFLFSRRCRSVRTPF